MAFGAPLKLFSAEKFPYKRHEGKNLSVSLAAVAGTAAVGNALVAPAAKAVHQGPDSHFKPVSRTMDAKIGIEAPKKLLGRPGGVDWSLFFSSVRAV